MFSAWKSAEQFSQKKTIICVLKKCRVETVVVIVVVEGNYYFKTKGNN